MAAANTTPQFITYSIQAFLGLADYQSNNIVPQPNNSVPNTLMGSFYGTTQISIPMNTVNNTFSFASQWPLANEGLVVTVSDVSNPGQAVNIGLASSGTRIPLAAGPGPGMSFYISGQMPVLYIDNPSMTANAILQIGIIAT